MSPPKGTTSKKPPYQRMTTPLPSDSNIIPLTLRLPLAYMRILGTESASLELKRGAFLTLLLRSKRGEVQVSRAKNAPRYQVTETELTERQMWIWYMSTEVRKQLDQDCLRMGLGTAGAWVTQALNNWIGEPDGLDVVTKRK